MSASCKPLSHFVTALEPRVLLDGAALTDFASVTSSDDSNAIDSATSTNTATRNEVYIVDATLPDLQTLIGAIPEGATVYQIQAHEDGFNRMAELLEGQSSIDAIHILGHGMAGQASLGTAILNASTLQSYSASLAIIGQSLTASGDVLLYGCEIASDEKGQTLVEQLASATSADIAASDDITGTSGDWELEVQTGTIEVDAIEADYDGDLGTFSHTLSTTIIESAAGSTVTKARGVTTDSSGNIYMVGNTNGNLNGQSVSTEDVYVVKYNSSGIEQWTKLVSVGGSEYASSSDSEYSGKSVAVDSSGNVYVTGSTSNGTGGYDMFVAKVSSDGSSVDWSTKSAISGNDYAMALELDSSNNVYVSGWAHDSGGFVVKYNSSGTQQWAETGIGGSGNNDRVVAIDSDSNGDIYILGSQNNSTRDVSIQGSSP